MNKTTVTQVYTPKSNVSITMRDGVLDKVTTWVSGVDKSTVHVVESSIINPFPRKR